LRYGKQLLIAAGLLVFGAVLVRGQLEPWVQHVPSGPRVGTFFRTVPMPGGAVPIRRPPAETRPLLSTAILAAPRDAGLYRLRAQEAELALDFVAAETDWKTFAQMAADPYQAHMDLADFYHRRIRPRDELAALTAATSDKDDPMQPVVQQRAWRAFERMASLVDSEHLPATVATPALRAWVARYPKEPLAHRRLIAYLVSEGQFAAAEKEIAAYGLSFRDEVYPVRARADLGLRRGSVDAAIRVYDQAFRPLWPDEMSQSCFELLERAGRLREFAGRARSALLANPADLGATARLFHYFRRPPNHEAQRRVLLEYRNAKESRKQPWTTDEIETLAQLFERLPDVNEAARLYYALYSSSPAGGASNERALYGLANLLLTKPDQRIHFGSGDLSLYKDIATVDASPGFLNGILSLVLNTTGPRWEYEQQNRKSVAYFHRAAAAQLVTLFEQRFPRSTHRAPLRASLVSAYAAYPDNDSVIRAGRAYLAAFPSAGGRFSVAMQVADALARQNKNVEEFALYDQFLRELAAKASGVPIGAHAAPPEQAAGGPRTASLGYARFTQFDVGRVLMGLQSGADPTPASDVTIPLNLRFRQRAEDREAPGARSTEYAQVLDRCLSRLIAMDRRLDALTVYRTEIDRNPNDPGLYERMAVFLDQNSMTQNIEEVYRRAIAKFSDRSWYHKLARWYLRNRQSAALENISRRAVSIFSGTELEGYFAGVVAEAYPDAVLYRQLNLYAHERFPEDLVFVRNLIDAYSRRESYDAAASDRLLRQYWFYDPQLRARLFEKLSREGRLYAELSEIRKANPDAVSGRFDTLAASNPAAVQFTTEAEAWLSHFEAAAPSAAALATAYPGRRAFAGRASALYRSLAAYFPQDTEIAARFAEAEYRSELRDGTTLAKIGDIFADRELFSRARFFWDRMPDTEPGKPAQYLDAATVFWDYYRFDDAIRLIAAARRKFADPSLFAYQGGAIYEGKRDYARAVREYVNGAMDGQGNARARLVRLSTRVHTRDLVDQATSTRVAGEPSWAAVSVRVSVLEVQQRRPELESLLRVRVEAEKSSEALSRIAEVARRLGFDAVELRAAERQVAIAADPVDKIQLTLALVRLYESKKDVATATRTIEVLYRGRPEILGVVRGAVDFQVRTGQHAAAISTLLDAARRARPDLSTQFTLEAARVATSAAQFERAREILTTQLTSDPYRIDCLTAMADTYLRANDDRGFREYQLATIQRLRESSLPPADRVSRVSTLRRSLIPALARLGDHAGATSQYIELINRYPEDEALTKEAASYAVAHGTAAPLLDFYRRTIADSPRDYRWPIVLGRVETIAEDFPAAIADYERALKARPDRSDVLEAKARLEERLMRFEDAASSYTRLYELTYRDPQWLIKVAEMRARLGQPSEAVTALKNAIIGERTETAEADFAIAERLESWHLLTETMQFAERGAVRGGGDLFETAQGSVYARIMARARRMDDVIGRLNSDPSMGSRVKTAAGQVIADLYTPEEKASLEQLLIARASSRGRAFRDASLLPLAASSGLASLEARWRYEAMSAPARHVDPAFVKLQWQRGLFGELGRQLEQYAAQHAGRESESAALVQSVDAFVADGDVDSQLRAMRKLLERNALSGVWRDRFLALLAVRHPAELISIARGASTPEIRNRAVQFALAGDKSQLGYEAVRARGSELPPLWTKAYTALAGVYLDDRSPAVAAAFDGALDTRNIGERIKTRLSRDESIAGPVWFYYAARYGEHLSLGGNAQAETYLPAMVEAAPDFPDRYLLLGDFYAGKGQSAKATAQFENVLQLDPDRADAHNHIARILWSEGKREEAVTRWHSALAALLRVQSGGVRVPESYWRQTVETFTDIGERRAMGKLRSDIEHLLSDYVHGNNNYRVHELVEPLARASLASGESIGWLVELSRSLHYPEILDILMGLPGLTSEQQISLQRDRISSLALQVDSSHGYNREYLENQLASSRVDLVSMLLDSGDVKVAATEWGFLSGGKRRSGHHNESFSTVEIRLAARTGTLVELLEKYGSAPEAAPSVEGLRTAALDLRRRRDEEAARSVLEFLYERELRVGRLDASNFLGLAELKLGRKDASAAMTLLRRMALVTDDGFDTLLPAADLLERYGRTAEAAEFIRNRVKAVPWDAEARLRLARVTSGGDRQRLFAAVRSDAQASYRHRVEAALATLNSARVADAELALLASGNVSAAAAARPYFLEARIAAAGKVADPSVRGRLFQDALALAPGDARARLGALQGAIALRRDSLALALAQPQSEPSRDPGLEGADSDSPRRRRWPRASASPVLPEIEMTDEGRASIAESLAAAAERLDDLNAAQAYLNLGILLRPPDQRDPLQRKLGALAAEQDRRARNASRQPVVNDVIEQDSVVRPRTPRSTQ